MTPASLHACGLGFPFVIATSICPKIVAICSGFYLCIGILYALLYQILSHFGWYNNPRSGQDRSDPESVS